MEDTTDSIVIETVTQTKESNYEAIETPRSKISLSDDSNKNTISIIQLFRYADTKDIILIVLGTLGAIVTGTLIPARILVFWGNIDNLRQPTSDDVNEIALQFVYLSIGALIGGILQCSCWILTSSRQGRRIRQQYIEALMRQDISWFDMNDPKQLASKVADVSLTIQDGMGRKVGDLLQFSSMSIGGLVIALIKGWELALVLLALTPIMAISSFKMIEWIRVSIKQKMSAYGTAGGIAEESICRIQTVQSLNAGPSCVQNYKKALDDASIHGIKSGKSIGIGLAVIFLTMFITYAIGMYVGAIFVSRDTLEGNTCTGSGCYDGGRVLTVFFTMIMGAMSFGQAGPSFQAVASAQAAAYDVFELINRASEIDYTKEEGFIPESIEGRIELHNVTFSYPSRKHIPVCKNFDLSIQPGQTVALVGPSGCGKSTVVALMERFYDPQCGTITLDGRDLRSLNINWLRRSISLVSQEPSLFACTIAENIRLGKPDASIEEIQEAARQANAYDFIMSFPDGFDTEVGQLGSQLSGGQKQRIAIARAIIRNPTILLLDEATSALDTESESIVQESLDRLVRMRRRTTIVIAHRLSTIEDADLIAFVSEGRIIEHGTYDELIEMPNGRFQEMVSQQSKTQKHGRSGERNSMKASKSTISEMQEFMKKEEEQDAEMEVKTSRIWKYSLPDKRFLFSGGIGSIISGSVFPVWGLLLAKVTVLFFKNNLTIDEMRREALYWSLAFLGLGLLFAFATLIQHYSFAVVSENLTKRLRVEAFDAILRQEIGWFDLEENSSGAITTQLATDAGYINILTGEVFNRGLSTFFTLGIAIGIGFYYSWELTLAMIGCIPLLVLSMAVQQGAIRKDKNGKIVNEGDTKAGAVISEAMNSIRTIVSYSMENNIVITHEKHLKLSRQTDIRNGFISGFGFGFAQWLMYVIMSLLFWMGGTLIDNGNIAFSDMFQVIMPVMLAAVGLGMVTAGLADYNKAKDGAKRIFRIIDRNPEIDAASNEGKQLEYIDGKIKFENVHFAYPSRLNSKIYNGYSLEIPSGSIVALVGASGGGKSTAINLIERFYNPIKGYITLDDVNIDELNIIWLRNQIGLVKQEPCLFSGTIAENIAFGKEEYSQEQIEEAAKIANAHEFIKRFPKGYKTQVGDNGIQVSGGQKQRICISRAILRDPKILLLDEATSALDVESERVVQESIDRISKMKKRTTIIVAHRLSTIRHADIIAVVNDGKIVEVGTHDELMNITDGIYKALISRQTKE